VTQILERLLVFPAIVLLLSGCAAKHRGSEPATVSAPARLQVENHNWLDVIIYVVHDGQTTRVGSATAATTTDFTLGPSLLGQLGNIQLIADPVGAPNGVTSPTIVVKAGTRVVWTLESDLSRSSLSVF
jgi:hypothetical protein